ncbi:hypothetical protein MUP46_03340 [Patescibacteria group bacterium]|nr:hypothetical protein [Patescibacteria group bacterium]
MKKIKVHLLFVTFFITWIVSISYLWEYPIHLFVILLLISIIYCAFLKKDKEIYYFIVAAVFGPLGEAIVSKSGLWTYHGVTIFGIPYWLPLAWGITAVAIKKYLESLSN